MAEFKIPTETVTLPSKGLLYPKESPLSKGEIEMKYMTAKEEDILTNANYLRNGTAIDKLLQALIVTPIDYNELLIGDKNAILISSRILAYGPEYNVTINDPNENESVDVKVDMSKLKIKEIDESLLSRTNEYEYVLPKTGVPVKFKLLTHFDELAIQKDIDASEKSLKQSNEITTRLRRVLTEVNGNRDLGYISNFVINQLQAADSRSLRKYMQTLTPDIDLSFDYTSPFTGETEALKVPIGLDFFYPAD